MLDFTKVSRLNLPNEYAVPDQCMQYTGVFLATIQSLSIFVVVTLICFVIGYYIGVKK